MKSTCFALVVCAAAAVPTLAQDDAPSLGRLKLDRGFGRSGAVRGIRAGGESIGHPQFIEVDAAGRVVIVGTTLEAGNPARASAQYAVRVARFLPDGRLDRAFGGNGIVTLPLDNEWILGFAVDVSGKITVSGSFRTPGESWESAPNYVAARLNADGSLDASFGGDGLLDTEEAPYSEGFGKIRAHPTDGSFIADVATRVPATGPFRRFSRVTPDGSLDTSFGVNGLADISYSDGDFAVDAEGGVVVAATSDADGERVYRLRPDGTPGPGFGTLGVLRGAGARVLRGEEVEIDGSGRILVVGGEDHVGRGIYRFTSDGRPDFSFGENGRAPLSFGVPGNMRARGVRLSIARDADQCAVSALTLVFRRGIAHPVADGYFVQGFDPESPATVHSFRRVLPRVAGQYPRSHFDGSAISEDGTSAFVIQHTEKSPEDLEATLLRVDLTRAAPKPLPNLTAQWAETPVLDRSGVISLTGPLLVRNTGRAAVADARIDIYLSLDDHLDAGDTLVVTTTAGALRGGAEKIRQPFEGEVRFQGVLTTERLIAHVNPLGELPELSLDDNIAVSEPIETR